MIMYSFKKGHSTCRYFIEIKSRIDDLCLSVRNDEKRICNKYLFTIFLESCYVRSNRIKISERPWMSKTCAHMAKLLIALPCGHTFCGPPRVYIEGVADGNKGMKCPYCNKKWDHQKY